jgi:uncharacterized protein YnzC (UPF0291/DUF896 family)
LCKKKDKLLRINKLTFPKSKKGVSQCTKQEEETLLQHVVEGLRKAGLEI